MLLKVSPKTTSMHFHAPTELTSRQVLLRYVHSITFSIRASNLLTTALEDVHVQPAPHNQVAERKSSSNTLDSTEATKEPQHDLISEHLLAVSVSAATYTSCATAMPVQIVHELCELLFVNLPVGVRLAFLGPQGPCRFGEPSGGAFGCGVCRGMPVLGVQEPWHLAELADGHTCRRLVSEMLGLQ